MRVRFNQPEEFLAELKLTAPLDQVVRVTRLLELRSQMPVQDVWVVAGFINPLGQLVECKTYCGEDWGKEFPHSGKTDAKAEAIIGRLRAGVVEEGYTARAGRFEEGKEASP